MEAYLNPMEVAMVKTLNGVRYKITSPSYWELDGYPVDVAFLGDQWVLCCPDEEGEPCFRYFPTREQAQAMIEQAFFPQGSQS
jgi:hypothetical protein